MNRGFIVRSALLSSVALLCAVPAAAQNAPLAGPKPVSVQTGRSAGCLGDVQLGSSIGDPRVARGFRLGQSWKIDNVTSTPAVCSFPSARPVDVSCVRDGRAVDPSYCQDIQFQQLIDQGYRTVNDSRDWSTAQWLLPGETDSGCIGEWRSTEGQKPMGCGDVDVPVISTCTVTNVQSGTPDNPSKYCTSAPPAATRRDTDYRACGYTIETGGWGEYSNSCGPVFHERGLTCRRADGTTLDMLDANCVPILAAYCASHSCQGSGNATREREAVNLPACSTDPRFVWQTGPWVGGGQTCGDDNQTRSVTCFDTTENISTGVDQCDAATRPAATRVEYITSGCTTVTGSCFAGMRIFTPFGPFGSNDGVSGTEWAIPIFENQISPTGAGYGVFSAGSHNFAETMPSWVTQPTQPNVINNNDHGISEVAVAVAAGARLTIYSGPNQTGTVVQDIVGPRLIQNVPKMRPNAEPFSSSAQRTAILNNPNHQLVSQEYNDFFNDDSRWLTWDFTNTTTVLDGTLRVSPLVTQFTPGTRSNASTPYKVLTSNMQGSFTVSCGPAPTPTPTPTPTQTGQACIGGTTVTNGSGNSVRNWPDELTSSCVSLGGNCFEDTGADLHDQEQNSYYWTVHDWRCVAGATSVGPGPDGQEAMMLTSTPTPVPTPTPTPNACVAGPANPSYTQCPAGYAYSSVGTGGFGCLPDSSYGTYVSNSAGNPAVVDFARFGCAPGYSEIEDVSTGSVTIDRCGRVCAVTPTSTPTPTPTSDPIPVTIGWCTYTSSGGGRYACGPYENYAYNTRNGGGGAPSPSQLCTGNLIAGVISSNFVGEYPYTYDAGREWTLNPPVAHVDGAQCIIRYRSLGYSDDSHSFWSDAYYSGPPTGTPGGLFKAPKP